MVALEMAVREDTKTENSTTVFKIIVSRLGLLQVFIDILKTNFPGKSFIRQEKKDSLHRELVTSRFSSETNNCLFSGCNIRGPAQSNGKQHGHVTVTQCLQCCAVTHEVPNSIGQSIRCILLVNYPNFSLLFTHIPAQVSKLYSLSTLSLLHSSSLQVAYKPLGN